MINLKNMQINTVFSEETTQEILKTLLSHGGDFAEIFIEKSLLQGISCEENKIEEITSGLDCGVGLRVICGEETYYASCNSLELAKILELAKKLSQATIKKQIRDKRWQIAVKDSNIIHKIIKDPQGVNITEKINLVNKVNDTSWKRDRKIRQVQVSYADKTKDVIIANTLNLFRQEQRIYVALALNVIVQTGTVVQTGREVLGGLVGFELFKEEKVENLIEKATNRALLMLDAKKAPTGKMAVVLDSQAGGTMIHEAIGHSLEADAIQKGISPVYSEKIGEQVASPIITVFDDATIPNMRGSYVFDDEGTPAQKTILVEKGILKNYLYDLFTANKNGKSSTGNGRRESYHLKPIPRMSNTYIASGTDEPGNIIKSTRKGLYVKKMGGGQVNTATGDFVFEVSEGYEITNGEIARPVRGAILTGNGPEVLKAIDMVANDLNFEIGTCGKDGQMVPVGDGQPTLRIPEIIVGGTE